MLLKSVPGIGLILSLVILYEIHDINRFERVQDFASYRHLVKCKRESAGKSYGTGGAKVGNAYLKWAFSEAAVLFLRGLMLRTDMTSGHSGVTGGYRGLQGIAMIYTFAIKAVGGSRCSIL